METNGASSGSPTDDQKSKLQRAEEIEFSLKRLKGLLDIANRCDLDKTELDEVKNAYYEAYERFSKGELTKAHQQLFCACSKFFRYLENIKRYRPWYEKSWCVDYIYCSDFLHLHFKSFWKSIYKFRRYLRDKMTNGATSDSPTDDLKSKLQRAEEIEFSLKRLKGLLDVANRCDLDKTELDKVKIAYCDAYTSFCKGELVEAHKKQFDAYLKLFQKINDTKIRISVLGFSTRLWGLKYISFMMRVYGITQLILSIVSAVFFSIILFSLSMDRPYSLFGVPLWAVCFAGLGYSIQTIMGVVGDVKTNGVLSEEKFLLYPPLLIVALIFGYLAYILIDLGMLTLGGNQGGQSASITATNISLIQVTGATKFDLTSNVSGNYTFAAGNAAKLVATGVDSFGSNIGNQAKIVACFLAGYATDDFINNLKGIASKK